MEDERRGLPSASGIGRLVACPGSWLLEQQCPEATSPDSEEGTMLHAVLAGERPDEGLTDDQRWVVDRCRELDEALPAMIGCDFDEEIREKRMWFASRTGEPLWSGKPDRMCIDTDAATVLISDYKFGRGEVAPADENMQARALALLALTVTAVETVFVAIIQPRSSEPLTICRYSLSDLAIASTQILRAIEAAQQPDAPRIPGEDQCRYCRAKVVCPEARETALAIVEVALPTIPMLTGEQFAEIIPQAKTAEKTIKAILDAAKQFVIDGGVIPGYELKPGNGIRAIPDPAAAYEALSDVVTAEEFQAVCSVGVGKLEALYGEKAGLKGKPLAAAFAARLGEAITVTPSAPSLARSKGASSTNAITE